MENLLVAEVMSLRQMVKHGWKHSTRATGGSGDDGAARGVLLAHGKGIGIDQASRLKVALIARCLDIICRGLTGQIERSWESSLGVDASFHSSLHGIPHFE